MESGSEVANWEFQLSGFNGVGLIENSNIMEKCQQIETVRNFSKGILEVGSPSGSCPLLKNQPISKHKLPASDQSNEVLESPSPKNGPNLAPSETLPADPTLIEASQMRKTSEHAKVEHGSPPARDDQPQLNQRNANLDTFQRRCVSHDNPNPLHDQVELISSPAGSTDEYLLHQASSRQNLKQPTYSGFKGSDSSAGDATAAPQTASSSLFSPLIIQPTQSFSLALSEKMPQNGSYATQSFYSKDEVNSVQANQLNNQGGSSVQDELLQPPRVEPDNRGKKKMFADAFEDNNRINHFNDNHRALPYSNLFFQSPSGIRFLTNGSSQINQLQSPSWFSNKENDLCRPLASGSKVNQFKVTNISDPHCYNFILTGSSAHSRPQQLNTSLQPINELANIPNASGSMLQHSELTKQSMPMQLMPQHFSYQHNQFPMAQGAYNSLTSSTMFHDPSMPLSSHQLPAHLQASNQFSMLPFLPYPEHRNSELPETSILSRQQTVQQQGLLNQTSKPIATYPSSGNSLSSLVLNSFLQQETGRSPAPHQMETSLSSNKEEGNSERRGHARSRFDAGESSSFKRFKRDSTMPQASSDEEVNKTFLSLLNEAGSSSHGANPSNPRQIRNSVYDPMFEGMGLPIDPHLRMFANRMG